ncbi:NAD(P)-dependent oxidoreductase [Cereibacter sp. SYSU M97828]|nr:NAD(P)-dependent oxidoreductase [Cereibacter flavus]
MKRLLITGAAGGLGSVMRQRLASRAEILRLSDIGDMGEAAPNEEIVTCDLGDAAAVDRLVEGCDAIIHLGGVSVERPFDQILNGNIVGMYNLYEAARAHGHPRILFASSNHTVGFYRQDEQIDVTAPMRPDGLYGVSKCFGEALARLYFDKFGQETAIVRIGSCFPEPKNHRMLSTWMSYDDFESLVDAVLRTPMLGCPIVWGMSDNDSSWWDNGHAKFLGWKPKDNAEGFRATLEQSVERPAPDHPNAIFMGGPFTQDPIFK